VLGACPIERGAALALGGAVPARGGAALQHHVDGGASARHTSTPRA
jgi:hypothetical protein